MRLLNVFNVLAITCTSSVVAHSAELDGRRSRDFRNEFITAHNFFRRQHGAVPLTWKNDLASKAQQWANTCNWFHDSAGENLASSTGFSSWGAFVNMWGSERKEYNWKNAGFSMHTGHFTQVVWKKTRSLGCGWKYCGGGQGKANGIYVVCKYDPSGNYQGQYNRNVGKQITGKAGDVWHE